MEENKEIEEIKEETPIRSEMSRRFLGVFPPVTNFDKKHLKSYLKGYTSFTYGRSKYKEPIVHQVKQEYYIRETDGK